MNFLNNRTDALKKLDNFIEKNLLEYSKLRNFDFGAQNRKNISCISPYVTHGIISEIEIINKVLKKHLFIKSEKFIQEVLWRVYWKGWLELKPGVWDDYLVNLKAHRKKYKTNKYYLNAIEGNTNIQCFNDWVKELKETNYLHNHARMWFASIWIFTLDLPWELGAEFFLRHLYDGDSASNTLGWRWVAGIQTPGKHYLASEWNIKKFTNNRYEKVKLNENAKPKISNKIYSTSKSEFLNSNINDGKNLLIFDNNLSFECSDFKEKKFNKILIVDSNEKREILLSDKVIKFKISLLQDQLKRLKDLSIDCEIIKVENIKKYNEDVYALYPSVGENLDFIISNKLENIQFLYRKIDQLSWKYCNKGFFNFKNYIPKIIQNIS
ncbi:MAG: DNA photolyase [Candidatus Pelagibacter sp.]|nr:DNA photolyase [Candidatus Pelagibacter sp.]OUT95741.1 MAG: DNA photolyase [Gammaproteobacteria bacterium TMED36]